MKTFFRYASLMMLTSAGLGAAWGSPGTPVPSISPSSTVRQIGPSTATAPPSAKTRGARKGPTCDELRRKGRYNIFFDKVDIEKLVQTVADATCKTFILPETVKGKVSIYGPENGKVEVNGDELYAAFLATLDSNNLAVYPHNGFLKIVDKRAAKQNTIPTIIDPDEEYTTNEQMITKMFRVRYVELEPLRAVVQQLVSKDGDTIPFQPDTLIVNDLGSNMHRLERIIEQLDRRSTSDEIQVIQIKYAAAQDLADKIQKLFENKNKGPGQRPATISQPGSISPSPTPTSPDNSGAPASLSQLIPDERTNKLIVIANPSAFERIRALINQIDIPMAGGGRVNVYYLENADAEELASTLQTLSQGANAHPRGASPGNIPNGQPGQPVTATSAELFSGEVKISANKATNSLVIIASQNDYRNMVKVIEKLDIRRRQVFVEAVIMEVNLDRSTEFGMELHSGFTLKTDQGDVPGLLGTKYTKQGLPPSFSLTNLASFGGFLAGLQGPAIPALSNLGINIPQFGIVLHALQSNSDVNVLSTPHLLTSDNEEAEITVGQNVPFQAGFSPANLGASALGAAGTTGANPALGGLGGLGGLAGGLGGLGSFFAPITRQNVELKLTIKPHINESDYIRMVINEHTEEIASQDPVLGPTTAKRSAKTTVVAKDQETVVIGGIMQDRTIESVSKVPILGDIPILGHLFRDQTRHKVKTNLLLFLTPYIIKDQNDFRKIFERKMRERQEFIEQFYGDAPGYEVAVDFSRKAGPLTRMNQLLLKEEHKTENGGKGMDGEKVFKPGADPEENAETDPLPVVSPPERDRDRINAPPPGQP